RTRDGLSGLHIYHRRFLSEHSRSTTIFARQTQKTRTMSDDVSTCRSLRTLQNALPCNQTKGFSKIQAAGELPARSNATAKIAGSNRTPRPLYARNTSGNRQIFRHRRRRQE